MIITINRLGYELVLISAAEARNLCNEYLVICTYPKVRNLLYCRIEEWRDDKNGGIRKVPVRVDDMESGLDGVTMPEIDK